MLFDLHSRTVLTEAKEALGKTRQESGSEVAATAVFDRSWLGSQEMSPGPSVRSVAPRYDGRRKFFSNLLSRVPSANVCMEHTRENPLDLMLLSHHGNHALASQSDPGTPGKVRDPVEWRIPMSSRLVLGNLKS